MDDGTWEGYRQYDKPNRSVRVWNLRIGSIFAGTVIYKGDNGSHWYATLNSAGLGGYSTAEQAMAVVDYQVWIEAMRAREGVRRVKGRIAFHPQSGTPVKVE